MRLSDSIEQFIKTLLEQDAHEIELKRNELAEYFGCAPSQINYVLATRFTQDHGYIIESHRGGGGYIRIVRVTQANGQNLYYALNTRIGEAINETDASRLVAQLIDRRLITPVEGQLMRAAISQQSLGIPIPEAMKDALRARIMRTMLSVIAQQKRDLTCQ